MPLKNSWPTPEQISKTADKKVVDQLMQDMNPAEQARKREEGLKELESLKQMAVNWKEQDYWPRLKDGDPCAITDFEEALGEHMEPYFRRLVATGHVTNDEMAAAFAFCYDQVVELKLWTKENKESEGDSIVGWLKSLE